jgi:hypothetical protein
MKIVRIQATERVQYLQTVRMEDDDYENLMIAVATNDEQNIESICKAYLNTDADAVVERDLFDLIDADIGNPSDEEQARDPYDA